MRKDTPWGRVQQAEELADGIISYSTAGHGGIWLSAERRKSINYGKNWLGTSEWWEEDCDWAVPYYFFRDDIRVAGKEEEERREKSILAAKDTIIGYHPDFAKREGLI